MNDARSFLFEQSDPIHSRKFNYAGLEFPHDAVGAAEDVPHPLLSPKEGYVVRVSH